MSETAPLWTSDDAVRATGGRSSTVWRASGLSIDSRGVRPGDLFVALRGPKLDGHAFVADAFSRGAVAAVVSRPPLDVPGTAPLLTVDETFVALRALGARARARSRARICAVTGSVGKTGVKEALRTVLSRQGATAANEGNLNNQWGLPLSLARMPAGTAYGVFEMGMNHPGELQPLSFLARPNVCVITTVEAVHKAHFASVADIADAKAEIFTGIEPGGSAVVNCDNSQHDRLCAAARRSGIQRILGFGRDREAQVRLLDASTEADGSRVRADVLGHEIDYRIAVPGSHWVLNSLCVLAAVAALGADVGQAADDLIHVTAPSGRGRRLTVHLPAGSFELIDESYNASPVAMTAAFEVLGRRVPAPGGRRIAILGDMLELGDEAPALHAGLAEPLQADGIDLVFTAGQAMAHLAAALPASMRGDHAEDSAGLAPLVEAAVRAGDVITVKGSAGSRMGLVVRALQALEADPNAERPRAANGG
ncbi:MAG: UDP-N-acetylmuramoylalanyl-D-glutamyl-2,6-diaminopimelate--D-alanyl-D-alanine ligase [Rhodospirillales bacterium]